MVAHLSHTPHLSDYSTPSPLNERPAVGRWSAGPYHCHARPPYHASLVGIFQPTHLCASTPAPLSLDNHIKAQVERVLCEMDTIRPATHEDDLDSPFTLKVLAAPVPLLSTPLRFPHMTVE